VGVIEERLAERGIILPAVFAGPSGGAMRFDLVRVVGDTAYVSGHGPSDGSEILMTGKVGEPPAAGCVSQKAGYEAARLTALSVLASLKAELGELDRVAGWLKVLGFVNVAPGFTNTPAVMNGFSDLVLDLWQERGHHARSAVGMAELPAGIPVEVEAIVALG
jgi:enamine deaminase RidA (YjgF/YER057c/UK114 family)